MCGIFAYKGDKSAVNVLINGLKNLEYRGYDSAGISVFNDNKKDYTIKSLGRVSNLATKIMEENKDIQNFNIGIAHTRWATHGGVEIKNTHPHTSQNNRFFLVHNGIIENYIKLKEQLTKKGYHFYGDTDSEVVAKLIEDLFEKDLETTLKKVKEIITGAYALVVVDIENPETIIALKLGSPLVLGFSGKEVFLSSDSNALSNMTQNYIPIDDNEMVIIDKNGYKILNSGVEIKKEKINSIYYDKENDMGSFKHFMEKEIFEIPNIIDNVLGGRVFFDQKEIKSNALDKIDIKNIDKIEIIASGTSYNAGLIASYLFEEIAEIQTIVHISTEFKYKKQFISPKTLYIFISQSGETADSLECLKMVKNKGGNTFGVVNVVGSSIARLTDNGLYTHSGVEIGVAASKTFIGQLLTLFIMSLYFGNKRNLDYNKYIDALEGLKTLKDDINKTLLDARKIKEISQKYSKYKNMFFLGRNMFYPLSMEGSLKCKEITYNHTESYSAGELKHGPLSLIDENFPSILLNPDSKLYDKNISSLKEIQARKGKVIGIISSGDEHKNEYDDTIEIPKTNKYNSLFTTGVVLQLFAYYMADELGREIDKPRNLAKSVTVE
ncbi:glutamine--fructose-6-phosphate transaminase (isomerizing) [Candidatus Gracilibacteria bacterium]|nr:glutamine--fructose-6-phosphate transaminase (isomerizing) [Candidatus Gracilibacteria bacterium]